MKTFAKIAWRNITRNKSRSLITISAIAIGLGALIFVRAFVDGADIQMIQNYTDLISGQLQIHADGFQKKMGLERNIPDPAKIASELSATPGIIASSEKIKNYVLVSSTEQSSGVLLIGIDPQKERAVTTLHKHIRKGEFLSEGKDDQIILGKDLLEILNVGIGDKVVIMAQGADGSLASGAYRVCGALDTGAEEIDKGMAIITLAAAGKLFVLEDRVSEFTIRAGDVYKLDDISRRLKDKFNGRNFEILTWKDISPILAQTIEFDKVFFDLLLAIFVLVVAIGILNTILMGVLERTREFGIMLALGTKGKQIVLMVALESIFLGFIGTAFGLIFGIILSLYLGWHGIDLSIFGKVFEGWYIGSIVYPRLFCRNMLLSSSIVLIISISAALYPAWKAARLKPVDAIRHFN
ncbi:MAG: ABC transporter permease [Candidatus Omnitrophica bacterium]|nr:ABC transporter permease [Candidatus Omnitrophota bacterium]